ATVEIQGNTIIDPIDTTAIRLGNQGPGLVVDNTVRGRPGAQAAVVWWKSFFHGADVATVGNTFTVAQPFDINGRHVSIDDRTVPRDDSPVGEPVPPATPQNRHREILEIPRGANAAMIQALITRAARNAGSRTVVHMPFGEYSIDRTIVVPPSDIQIIGDG